MQWRSRHLDEALDELASVSSLGVTQSRLFHSTGQDRPHEMAWFALGWLVSVGGRCSKGWGPAQRSVRAGRGGETVRRYRGHRFGPSIPVQLGQTQAYIRQ